MKPTTVSENLPPWEGCGGMEKDELGDIRIGYRPSIKTIKEFFTGKVM